MTDLHAVMLNALDRRVELRTNDSSISELLDHLWQPFITAGDGADYWVELLRRDHGWSVRSSVDPSQETEMVWEALLRSRVAISRAALNDRTDLAVIHAATAFRRNEALLIVGHAGAGKTTLCAEMCRSDGWAYGSDDVAPIALASGLLFPFPRPPAFKGTSLTLKDFASRWSPPNEIEAPSGPFLVPPEALGAVAEAGVAPTMAVFPSFMPGSPGTVSLLSSAEAAKAMLSEAYEPTAGTLSFVAGLCRRVPAYRMEYATSEKALGLLSELTKRR